jgi:hypothetical protein
MYGISIHDEAEADPEHIWTFNAVNNDGKWLIDSMNRRFTDNSGATLY